MSLLVTSEILGLFFNTLTDNDRYSLCNSEYVLQLIQMIFSKRKKSFSQFFCKFLKFTSNFEHSGKKNDSHSLCIYEVTDCEKSG